MWKTTLKKSIKQVWQEWVDKLFIGENWLTVKDVIRMLLDHSHLGSLYYAKKKISINYKQIPTKYELANYLKTSSKYEVKSGKINHYRLLDLSRARDK